MRKIPPSHRAPVADDLLFYTHLPCECFAIIGRDTEGGEPWPRFRIFVDGDELKVERVDEYGNPIAAPKAEDGAS